MPRCARAPTSYEKSTREIADAVVELRRLRKPNLSEYARLHNLPYQRLHRAFNGGNNRSTRAPTNRKLSNVQEASLVYYLDAVDAVGFGVTKYMVEAQANHLLKQAFEDAIDSEPDILDPAEPPVVGQDWARCWLKRHTKYTRLRSQPIELTRKLAQALEALQRWFTQLKELVDLLGIQEEDLYNMDETGIRIGISKRQAVYTQHGRDVLVPTSNNRELVSLVECISASGLAPWAPEVVLAAVRLMEVPRVDLQPAEVYRDNAGAPDDLQDWRTPRTTRVLNNQLTELQQRLWEDYDVDDDLLSALDTTYKGALAMAQATQGLAKALQQTKAAEIARAERRERAVHRRRLNEGGPLYAKDARRMQQERAQAEEVAMFDTQQTAEQDAESSEESSVGYSSPLSRFYNDDLLDEHHSNKARDL
ncbi:hypothetical protein GGP41_001475 [Bipolaris sorokiniana]|uniref:HTH CENPB-type domain-containing protein n=1 Tax=Cochliobolus sativus TaxID=45130 RepID=A0A8H5Z7P1_COCSA|nr:hypothetical protein GGP41_001475 [Bipolaris sorokiniana]